jgi:hypothetical protein
MTKAFTQATGMPVKLDDNSTGPLLTQIEGLLLKGFEPSVHSSPVSSGTRWASSPSPPTRATSHPAINTEHRFFAVENSAVSRYFCRVAHNYRANDDVGAG